MRHDLHVHTAFSDGVEAPAVVVREAAAAGLAGIAITDHDTTLGVPEAAAEGTARGVEVIPGVEITASVTVFESHILGYFINPLEGAVPERLAGIRRARVERAREILDRLRAQGLEVSEAEVVQLGGPRAVGRPHIARLLVAKGYAADVRDAMRRFLSKDAPAYVPTPSLHPLEAVELIRADGGAAALAHPGLTGQDDLIEELARAGLVGLEAHHPGHSPEQVERYAELARANGLIATGGSDYHGRDARWRSTIGSYGVTAEVVEALRARRG